MVAMATMRGGVVLCMCVAMCWGGAAAQLGSSGRSTADDSEVQRRATESNGSAVLYVARLEFDMRAMGPLYNSSPLVVDFIAKKEAYPEGMVSVSDGHVNVKPLAPEWRTLLVHYLGPAFVVAVAALVIVLLPLAGLIWCCFYCCLMGRRRRNFDRKYDVWLKGIFAIVLILLLTAFLFGVVCAFATDSQVDSGLAEASDSMRSSLQDALTFFNETLGWTHTLIVDDYTKLENSLNQQHQISGMRASWKMGAFSRASSVTTLNRMVQDLDSVQQKLRFVQENTATLRLKAEQLNSGLRKVKNQLLQTLAKCDQPKCRALQEKYKIGQLDTEIQYSQMPDVSELLRNVTELLDSGIKQDLAEAQRVFDELQRSVQRAADARQPSLGNVIGSIGGKLKELARDLSNIVHDARNTLRSKEKYINQYEELYQQYGPYRRYVALAASCALLLITSLLTLGLLCGVCGKRPDAYGASDCCNKGAGSTYLLCGMGFIYLLGGLVTLVLLAHFAAGLVVSRLVCDPLTEPRGNRVFHDMEQMVDLEQVVYKEHKDPNFNLTSVLVACHANNTLYRTLHLWRMLGISKLRSGLHAELQRRTAHLNTAAPPPAAHVTLLRPGARAKLRQLADTGLSDFDFDRILSALETNMTTLALDPLAAQLNSTARSLQQPLFSAEAASLRLASVALSDLQQDVLRPMMDISAQLNETARELRDDLRFNHSSLKEAITYLLHETSEGEAFLNDSRKFFGQIFNNILEGLYDTVDQFLQNMESSFLDRGAHCGPISNAYNVSRDAFCLKVLLPVHGYWVSLSWCALLLLPLLLAAGRLARLYRHSEPYPGPRADAEYLYDAYADRDNVPLANAYKAEKRRAAPGSRSRSTLASSAETSAAGQARDSTLAPSLDSYHARRYNDMAPKHWEEGPPRYLGSTEYERPPPYYYPGPHDRQ